MSYKILSKYYDLINMFNNLFEKNNRVIKYSNNSIKEKYINKLIFK